jgi:alcohol dehydrogenase class IV
MSETGWRAAGFSWRLYCGRQVLEQSLKEAVTRAGARRAFVICSPSITRRTDSVTRIARALGNLCVGVFDAVENDATFTSVQAGTSAAIAARADLLIAVGGGSVIMAARGIAIFMAEKNDPFQLMTQYPEGRPAYSPRLMATKPPIINVPTTPNSAMNRAGTALKNPHLDHRMEFFDPKTRPHSIFLDEQALLATPAHLVRSTAATVFASSVAAQGQLHANPLVEADDDQAFRLAYRACQRLPDEPDNPALLIDLAIAAFLRNRAEDDGMSRLLRGRTFAGNYAISTAIHIRYPRIGQGESTSAIHSARIRISDSFDTPSSEKVARALDVWCAGMDGRTAALAVADRLDALYTRLEMPTRVHHLDIPREDFPKIAADTVKNFNANAGSRSPQAQIAEALRLLEAAY